ncbi:MFS transporter [Liquorilactobacillus oeni]|nr:MFS transporter [Liquorilactobacillus oeni]
MTIYFLTMAIAIPLLGKLSDIYGFKKIYLFGIFTFLIGSLLAAAASNIWVLISGRAI